MSKTGYHASDSVLTCGDFIIDKTKSYTAQSLAELLGVDRDFAHDSIRIDVRPQWTKNECFILYCPNGGTTDCTVDSNGFIQRKTADSTETSAYFHKVAFDNSTKTYPAADLKLSRKGYELVGWQVRSTGTLLNPAVYYISQDVFADGSDATKTASNTATVYCYLDAVWKRKNLLHTYNNGKWQQGVTWVFKDNRWQQGIPWTFKDGKWQQGG
jgi:hypothetical protein